MTVLFPNSTMVAGYMVDWVSLPWWLRLSRCEASNTAYLTKQWERHRVGSAKSDTLITPNACTKGKSIAGLASDRPGEIERYRGTTDSGRSPNLLNIVHYA